MTATVKVTVDVPVDGKDVKQLKQYGMRYPDGSIKWDADSDGMGRSVYFHDLQRKEQATVTLWERTLNERAVRAKVDPEDHFDNHVLVERTVILAFTEPEGAHV